MLSINHYWWAPTRLTISNFFLIAIDRPLRVTNDVITRQLNGISMTTIRQTFVSRTDNVTLQNVTVFGDVITNRLSVDEINGIVIEEEVVYRSRDQTVVGRKWFDRCIVGNITVPGGSIGGVDVLVLKQQAVYKNGKLAQDIVDAHFLI